MASDFIRESEPDWKEIAAERDPYRVRRTGVLKLKPPSPTVSWDVDPVLILKVMFEENDRFRRSQRRATVAAKRARELRKEKKSA